MRLYSAIPRIHWPLIPSAHTLITQHSSLITKILANKSNQKANTKPKS